MTSFDGDCRHKDARTYAKAIAEKIDVPHFYLTDDSNDLVDEAARTAYLTENSRQEKREAAVFWTSWLNIDPYENEARKFFTPYRDEMTIDDWKQSGMLANRTERPWRWSTVLDGWTAGRLTADLLLFAKIDTKKKNKKGAKRKAKQKDL